MSPTPKTYNWSLKTSQQREHSSLGWSPQSLDCGKSGSSNLSWGESSTREHNSGSTSLGWSTNTSMQESSGFSSLSYLQANSSFVNVGSTNNNESLPKFSETFCSSHTASYKLNQSFHAMTWNSL